MVRIHHLEGCFSCQAVLLKMCLCIGVCSIFTCVKLVVFHGQDPQILDINANSSQVRLLLGEIQISIDELQAQASAYTAYQKKFKVIF